MKFNSESYCVRSFFSQVPACWHREGEAQRCLSSLGRLDSSPIFGLQRSGETMPQGLLGLGRLLLAVGCVTAMLGSQAQACGLLLRVTYAEDYPDWFFIEFLEGDGYALTGLGIDLGPAVGRPFIDTAYPNSRHSGRDGVVLAETRGLDTGSSAMALKFEQFSAGKSYRLLVDLDGRADQLEHGELFGGNVAARFSRDDGSELKLEARFDGDGVAELGNRACA